MLVSVVCSQIAVPTQSPLYYEASMSTQTTQRRGFDHYTFAWQKPYGRESALSTSDDGLTEMPYYAISTNAISTNNIQLVRYSCALENMQLFEYQ